jgi:hypothetical protein
MVSGLSFKYSGARWPKQDLATPLPELASPTHLADADQVFEAAMEGNRNLLGGVLDKFARECGGARSCWACGSGNIVRNVRYTRFVRKSNLSRGMRHCLLRALSYGFG